MLQSVKDAGTIAGINVLHIINTPSAAACGYYFDKISGAERNVLIFDAGGGALSISIITCKKMVL